MMSRQTGCVGCAYSEGPRDPGAQRARHLTMYSLVLAIFVDFMVPPVPFIPTVLHHQLCRKLAAASSLDIYSSLRSNRKLIQIAFCPGIKPG